MRNAWTRFAATGNPNPAGATTWEPYEPATDPYYIIDAPHGPDQGLRTDKCDFWDSLGSVTQ